MRVIAKLDRLLCGIETVMMVSLTSVGITLGVLQVVLRYVFNTGFPWLEGVLVISLIWAMLFGASRAVRQGYHPRVDLLPLAVPPTARAVLNVVGLGLALTLCAFYAYDSVFYARFLVSLGILQQNLDIPAVYVFLVIPITTVFLSIRYVLILCSLRRQPDAAAPETIILDMAATRSGDPK